LVDDTSFGEKYQALHKKREVKICWKKKGMTILYKKWKISCVIPINPIVTDNKLTGY